MSALEKRIEKLEGKKQYLTLADILRYLDGKPVPDLPVQPGFLEALKALDKLPV
jgi:hypothetical protein